MDYKIQIDKYYNDLFSKTEYINLLMDSSLRQEVLRNIDWTDPNTKKILITLISVDSIQNYTLPNNKNKFIELIKMLNLDQDQKEFLISFEKDLSLLVPDGGGGGSEDRQPNNKDNSEEMKKMIREVLNAATTVGLVLNIIVNLNLTQWSKRSLNFQSMSYQLKVNLKKRTLN